MEIARRSQRWPNSGNCFGIFEILIPNSIQVNSTLPLILTRTILPFFSSNKNKWQVDHPIDEGRAHWAHPIDLHYAIKGIQGWPKVSLQVLYPYV